MMTKTKLEGKFYPLTADVARTLRFANLTAAEWRLWSYLAELDPWGDRYEPLPDIFSIMQTVEIKKSTFYKAISKFQEFKIFDFQSLGLAFRNLFGVSKLRNNFRENGKVSENSESSPKIRKTVRENGKQSENSENQELECLPDKESGSLQTNQTVQSSHTLQIPEPEKIQKTTNVNKEKGNNELNDEGNNELNNTTILAKKTINDKSSSAQKKENFPKENNCRGGRSISENKCSQEPASNITVTKPQPVVRPKSYNQQSYNPQAVVWNWLPDGPWLVEGKLDVNFQEWLAKKWMVKHGDDIYEAKANVLSYFRNDPARLAIRWGQYQEEYIAKAGNFKTRLDHGCQITEEEKQQAISNRNAIKPLLPEQELTSGNASGRIQNSEFRTLRQSSVQAQNSTKQLPATSSSNENPSKTIEPIEGEVIEPQQNSKDEFNSLLDEDFWEEVKEKDNQKLAEIEANYYQSSDAPTNNSITTQSKTDSNNSTLAYSNTTIGQDLVLTDELSGRTVIYKDFTGIAEQQEKEVSPEQRKRVLSMISDFVNGFKLKKAEAEAEASKEPPQELLGDLELLNQDLTCPVIRKDSITKNRVQKWLNAGYSCDYDLDGNPCFVYQS